MTHPSVSPRSRKGDDKPQKPYPDFPLTPHASGAWQKKIRGRIHYFGKWGRRVDGKLERIPGDGWKEALEEYKRVADDLHAGRTPRTSADGLTVGGLCNHFLTAKIRKVEAGEMTVRSMTEYRIVTDELVACFGTRRLVDDLAANDFGTLRARLASKWGPVRLANAITRIKSVFKFAVDNSMIERTIRYGSEFQKPSMAVLRRHRAKQPAKMFERDELLALIDGAVIVGEIGPELVKPDATLRAMILLGINAALGNADISKMTFGVLDLKNGFIDYPREKTGIPRRCPLWPETVSAIKEVIASRPASERTKDDLVFLSKRGNPFINSTDKFHKDLVTIQFTRLLRRLGIHRTGVGYYALRHTFRTVADEVRDTPAIDMVMGHTDTSMAAHYRERLSDDRLRAVTEHVRCWLFSSAEGGAA